MLETDARVALIRDWLSRELRLQVARIERCELPALLPGVLQRGRLRRDGCAAREGGRAAVPEGVAAACVARGARPARARDRRRARTPAARGSRRDAVSRAARGGR